MGFGIRSSICRQYQIYPATTFGNMAFGRIFRSNWWQEDLSEAGRVTIPIKPDIVVVGSGVGGSAVARQVA